MARKDQITNKKALVGNNRSHALNQTKRVWNLNLQKVTIYNERNEIVTIKASARTIKALKRNNKIVKYDYTSPKQVFGSSKSNSK